MRAPSRDIETPGPAEMRPSMRRIETPIHGCYVVKFPLFEDKRGCFLESYNEGQFNELGLPARWYQDNVSVSHANVLRGLHVQKYAPQGKLVRCLAGAIWDVCVDIRPGSPTFGQYFGVWLEQDNHNALYLPPGTAHGFITSPDFSKSVVHYKCTSKYMPQADGGIAWNDPTLKIAWPRVEIWDPIVSQKDRELPNLSDYLKLSK